MSNKKRKVDSECRVFNEEWTKKYFFTDTGPSKAACLIGNETCVVFKEYNIKKHFVAKHKDFGQQFSTQELKICYKCKFCFGTQDCKRQQTFFRCRICEKLHS